MDQALFHAESFALAVLIGAGFLAAFASIVRRWSATVVDLECVLLVGLAYRLGFLVAADVIDPGGFRLRGADDAAFLDQAHRFASMPLDFEWLGLAPNNLHALLLSLQLKALGDPGTAALRVQEVTIELFGIGVAAVAVAVIAGKRPAQLFAWIAVLEPTNAYFATFLHKESLMIASEAFVVLGVSLLWTGRSRWAAAPIATGLALAVGARPYAIGGLVAGLALVAIHLMARRRVAEWMAGLVVGVAATIGLAAAIVTGPKLAPAWLDALQRSQDFVPSTNANLQLGPVDVSTPVGLATAIASRTASLIAQPFPWQLGNLQQRLGALGTLGWWALVGLIVVMVARRRFRGCSDLLPFVYLGLGTALIYALTLTNAGSGFRHRVHLVLLAAGALAILLAPVVGQERHLPRIVRRTLGRDP